MNQEVVLRVSDLARGGAGVARDTSGRVVFIPYTAPGDLVKVRIIEENKRYAQAELLEVLEFSEKRQIPRCPVFGKCGGCQWQHLPYSLQWETKSKGVLQALKRVEIKEPDCFDQIPAERIWEYRNRIQLRGQGQQLGYFKPKTQDLVPAARCDIARPEINQVWEQAREKGTLLGRPYKVEIEVTSIGQVTQAWDARHSAGGFRQVHDEQNEKLKKWIADHIGQGDLLLDLFGGSGNLCSSLSSQFREIHCVDVTAPLFRPEKISENVHFHRSSVLSWLLKEVKGRGSHASLSDARAAIMDPPREGLGKNFVELAQMIEVLKVKKIVLVGCDPDAWAKDLSRWAKRGWSLRRVMVIDLFPQTPHIESVGLIQLD
jgi:23S rRNA (uracil1939-C5)-methyltransferase